MRCISSSLWSNTAGGRTPLSWFRWLCHQAPGEHPFFLHSPASTLSMLNAGRTQLPLPIGHPATYSSPLGQRCAQPRLLLLFTVFGLQGTHVGTPWVGFLPSRSPDFHPMQSLPSLVAAPLILSSAPRTRVPTTTQNHPSPSCAQKYAMALNPDTEI